MVIYKETFLVYEREGGQIQGSFVLVTSVYRYRSIK